VQIAECRVQNERKAFVFNSSFIILHSSLLFSIPVNSFFEHGKASYSFLAFQGENCKMLRVIIDILASGHEPPDACFVARLFPLSFVISVKVIF
jgi:hypothetical protein